MADRLPLDTEGLAGRAGLGRVARAVTTRLPASWGNARVSPAGVAALVLAAVATWRAAVGCPAAPAAVAASAALLGIERALGAGRATPLRVLVVRAGPLATVIAVAMALGVAADGGSAAALWAASILAFSQAAQEYVTIQFGRSIRNPGLGRPLDLGVVGPDGAVAGLPHPPPLAASLLRLQRDDALLVLAAAAVPGPSSLPILCAGATLSFAGFLWTTCLRGVLVFRLERLLRPRQPASPPGLHGRERIRRLLDGMAAARDDAFWGLAFARPVVVAVLFIAGEVRWLTPNVVTALSMVVCLAAGGLGMLDTTTARLCAVALILVRSVLDSLDGQLARYRGLSSEFGSFFDKASDSICWAALYAAAAVQAYRDGGHPAAVLIPMGSVTALSFQGVTMWLLREQAPAAPRAAGAPPVTLRAWARNLWRVVLFEEPDFYAWISVALVLDRYDWLLWLLAATHGLRVAGYSAWRVAALSRLTPQAGQAEEDG